MYNVYNKCINVRNFIVILIEKIIRLKNSFREIYVYYIILHNSTIHLIEYNCFVLSISIKTIRIHCTRTFFFKYKKYNSHHIYKV